LFLLSLLDAFLAVRNSKLDVVGASSDLASTVHGYAQDQIQDLVLKSAMASETLEELRGALSKAVAIANALDVQLKEDVARVQRNKGNGSEKDDFDMAAFQERFLSELNGVVVKLTEEYGHRSSEDSSEERESWCAQPAAVSKVLDWVEDAFVNAVNGLWGLPEDTYRKYFRQLRTHLEEIFFIVCTLSNSVQSMDANTLKGKILADHPYLRAAIFLLVMTFFASRSLCTVLMWLGFSPIGPVKGNR